MDKNRITRMRKTVYRCAVCGAEYASKKNAENACGKYKLEPPAFAVGDRVTAWYAKEYRRSEVIKVVGPVIGNMTTEYGVRRPFTDAHVYQYHVKPLEENSEIDMNCFFWTSELKKT